MGLNGGGRGRGGVKRQKRRGIEKKGRWGGGGREGGAVHTLTHTHTHSALCLLAEECPLNGTMGLNYRSVEKLRADRGSSVTLPNTL